MKTIALVVFSLAVTLMPDGAEAQVPQEGAVIVTRGSGTIKRAPDQAWVTIGAETRATTPAEAQRLAAEAMAAVMKSIGALKMSADAIKTTGYSLQPDIEYTDGRQHVRGYIARNQIEVRVDDLPKVAAVIDAVGPAGATSVPGLRFDLKGRAEAERQALQLAVEDALGRARAMAAGAGASLGPILRIEEFSHVPSPVPYQAMRAMSAESAPTPISAGDLEIHAEVALTVSIRQP